MPSLIDKPETLTLHDLVQYFKHFGLVDEERTALMTVLGILHRQNYIIEALSGNGKTFLTRITLTLFPEDRIHIWGLDTDAAAFEDQAALQHAWIIFITELQKFVASDSIIKRELLKDLGEDMETGASRRRVSGFKEGGRREVEELSIGGDKCVISTLAVENRDYKGDDVELTRRYPTFSLDTSPEHIRRIVDRQLALEFKPTRMDTLTTSRISAVRARCESAYLMDRDIHNPVAFMLKDYIPVVDVQTPSFVNRFNKFMKATTRFYSWRAYNAPDGSLYTTIPDVWELWEVYSDMFWMTINHIPFLGKRIVRAIQDAEEVSGRGSLDAWQPGSDATKAVSMKGIHRQLAKMNLPLPFRTLTPLVNRMCDQAFLERHEHDRNRPVYSVADEVQPISKVDWKGAMKGAMDLIKEVDGAEVAKDWRDSQLDGKGHLQVIHPVTGEKIKVF